MASELTASPEFTKSDWFTGRIPNFKNLLLPLAEQPNLEFLELGSCEGRSAVWMLENVLTHPTSHLWCVDSQRHRSPVGRRLRKNLAPYRGRVEVAYVKTNVFLSRLPREPRFHFVYVDASHATPYVLEDAILSWPLVRPGGRVLFDDYGAESVRVALDIFMQIYQGCYQLLFQNWQLALQKIRDW